MGCDDLDRLGWPQMEAFLARDGILGFRLIPAERIDRLEAQLTQRGFRLDTWDVFLAERARALPPSQNIVAQELPNGLSDLPRLTRSEDEYTAAIQALIASVGVVPFSGSMLVGECGPATTVAVGDENRAAVAAAHGYFPHNSHSPFHRHAWGGLVAVAPSHREKGLGKYINARMIVSVFEDLGATHIYELVSRSNAASRHMVEACGLRHASDLVCGIASPAETARFTR